MKSKMNTWTAIFNIINCVMLFISWFVVIAQAVSSNGDSSSATFFYIFTWIGVVLNILSFYYAKQLNISVVGAVLGIIGSLLSGLSMIFAFPSIVLLIIAVVFEFLQKPAKGANDAK
ncbi:transporter [Apilactobacillus micheneri]|uniref:transporter n=1 Tax=Apilactobacillus micheneri TaxID=1899430 RepID=UPI001126A64B|nr:transporter [Apilactobacillus micheneri]TPR41241.1 transporter [Apilactobacillus micheneri]